MYGTIARLHVAAGQEAAFKAFTEYMSGPDHTRTAGLEFVHVYQSDSDPRQVFLAVGFTDKAAYQKNAQSPEQAEVFAKMRATLESDPDWHDGEIVHSETA
jgi:heme-degrading monooxygenase HmoA